MKKLISSVKENLDLIILVLLLVSIIGGLFYSVVGFNANIDNAATAFISHFAR